MAYAMRALMCLLVIASIPSTNTRIWGSRANQTRKKDRGETKQKTKPEGDTMDLGHKGSEAQWIWGTMDLRQQGQADMNTSQGRQT